MRVLWLLPKAAPALLRHIGAYVELVAFDLEQSRRDFTANVLVSMVAGVCVFFAVLMGCVVIIALTWDTPYRVAAVAWTGGGFLTIAVLALIYRSKAMQEHKPFLDSVKREWQEDVVVLEAILAEHEPARAESASVAPMKGTAP
ncbi:MAG: phage holin family protein [Steroidobacteraceae bacterium]|jgi:uncharacterized membrane protein YqjE